MDQKYCFPSAVIWIHVYETGYTRGRLYVYLYCSRDSCISFLNITVVFINQWLSLTRMPAAENMTKVSRRLRFQEYIFSLVWQNHTEHYMLSQRCKDHVYAPWDLIRKDSYCFEKLFLNKSLNKQKNMKTLIT